MARLDEEADLLFEDDRRFRMVIVGGSTLILLETITPTTHDIDELDVSPEIADLLEKYDINTRVGTFINDFLYNYDERLVSVRLNGRRIDFYTALLEDIVIAKLYSGRATDIQDIMDPRVLREINWDRLEYLATADELTELFEQASPVLPFGYHKVWKSYQSRKNRAQTDAHTKELMRQKVKRLQEKNGVTNYSFICEAWKVRVLNLNDTARAAVLDKKWRSAGNQHG